MLWPGVQYFRSLLDQNDITNCPFTSADKIAEDIWGKDVVPIRGRGLRKPAKSIPKLKITQLPAMLSCTPYQRLLLSGPPHERKIERREAFLVI
jgi:hypothetical protein